MLVKEPAARDAVSAFRQSLAARLRSIDKVRPQGIFGVVPIEPNLPQNHRCEVGPRSQLQCDRVRAQARHVRRSCRSPDVAALVEHGGLRFGSIGLWRNFGNRWSRANAVRASQSSVHRTARCRRWVHRSRPAGWWNVHGSSAAGWRRVHGPGATRRRVIHRTTPARGGRHHDPRCTARV
jgi:hypothetical protein